MIREGTVGVIPTDSQRNVTSVPVMLNPLSGCGSCQAAGGCGIKLLPSSPDALVVDATQAAHLTLCAGDQVQVHLPDPDTGWLRMVVLAYGLPSLGMLFGALAGFWLADVMQLSQWRDALSFLGFVAGLGGGLIAWNRAEKSVTDRVKQHLRPESASIIKIIEHAALK